MFEQLKLRCVRRGDMTRESSIGAVSGVAIRRGHNLPDEYGKQAGIGKTRRRHLRAYPIRSRGRTCHTPPTLCRSLYFTLQNV